MPTGIKREFGRSDAALAKAEEWARAKGGGEVDGAVYVIEVITEDDIRKDLEATGVIWVASTDRYAEVVHDPSVWHHNELACFGFDEDEGEHG